MAIIFDGKRYAQTLERELTEKVKKLEKRGIHPRLETILDTKNSASVLYISLKKKAAARIGVDVGVYPITRNKRDSRVYIKSLIRNLNKDREVHGIMIQLPLKGNAKAYTNEFIKLIANKKDVDGLKDRSRYIPATVKAILKILDEAKLKTGFIKKNKDTNLAVVGSRGMVGKPLVRKLKKEKYKVILIDKGTKKVGDKIKSADIVISATGRKNTIKGPMVKEGVIIIDVGSPVGDVDFNDVVGKASFITPVPGGVGPVTVVSLLENLVIAVSRK